MTGDLAVWLRAQLDADEQTARAATPGPWAAGARTDNGEVCVTGRQVVDPYAHTQVGVMWGWKHAAADAEHIALHDPAFTLADITAKKEIVAEHWTTMQPWGQEGLTAVCGRCRYGDGVSYRAPCPTLCLLAQPYAGRPGWHNEWTMPL